MKSLLVYLLLAAVSAEVFSAREDMRDNELLTSSLTIPQIGRLLQKLKNQDDFASTLGTEMETEAIRLEGVMKNFTDEAINNIKGMNKSEQCTELGIKLAEIEHFYYEKKILKCVTNTVDSMTPPNRMSISEIYNRVNKYGAHVIDAEIKDLIKAMNEFNNSIRMSMGNLTAGIAEHSFNCIHEILDDFNSTMSNLTMLVDRCSKDNDTSSVSSITLLLTDSFDPIVSLSKVQEKFVTILMEDSLLSKNQGTEMDKKMNEVINVINTSTKNQLCLKSGFDRLFIDRLGSWLGSKQCEGETVSLVFPSSPIKHDLKGIIAHFFNYADNLINGDGIRVRDYEMMQNIHTLQMVTNRLMGVAEKLTASNNCFEKNQKNFESSIFKIFAQIRQCQIGYGFFPSV